MLKGNLDNFASINQLREERLKHEGQVMSMKLGSGVYQSVLAERMKEAGKSQGSDEQHKVAR